MASIPCGSIIAFAGDTVPAGWSECNGGNGTPDLRGMFLQGLDSDRNPGDRVACFSNPVWYHSDGTMNRVAVRIAHVPTNTNKVSDGGPCRMVNAVSKSTSLSAYGGDIETRPTNVAVRWIMMKDAHAAIPAGSIIPFRPSAQLQASSPPWLLCAGQRHGQQKYSQLYSAIGDIYLPEHTDPDDVYFHVPDLRGMFLRGLDTGAIVDDTHGDPNPTVRMLFAGKLPMKSFVGTYQSYATDVQHASNWTVDIAKYPDTTGTYDNEVVHVNNVSGHSNLENGALSTKQIWNNFGLESRPRNTAYPHFVAGAEMDQSEFPIGGIIAAVSYIGDGTTWQFCEGGPTTPQLMDMYIRGQDDRPAASDATKPVPVWADPDRPRAPDSFQGDCIGCPWKWKAMGQVTTSGLNVSVQLKPTVDPKDTSSTPAGLPVLVPGNHRTNSRIGSSHTIYEWNPGQPSFPVSSANYTEDQLPAHPTIPKSVYVAFYIKSSN